MIRVSLLVEFRLGEVGVGWGGGGAFQINTSSSSSSSSSSSFHLTRCKSVKTVSLATVVCFGRMPWAVGSVEVRFGSVEQHFIHPTRGNRLSHQLRCWVRSEAVGKGRVESFVPANRTLFIRQWIAPFWRCHQQQCLVWSEALGERGGFRSDINLTSPFWKSHQPQLVWCSVNPTRTVHNFNEPNSECTTHRPHATPQDPSLIACDDDQGDLIYSSAHTSNCVSYNTVRT